MSEPRTMRGWNRVGRRRTGVAALLLVAGCAVAALAAAVPGCIGHAEYETRCEDGMDLYRRRIEPLLTDERPQTCNQCHLSGIDLGLFVRDTPCETMACLVDFGLVDLSAPNHSVILSWIGRAMPDSELITEQVIQAEYDAFLEWVEHSSQCFARQCQGVTCGPRDGEPFCEEAEEPAGEFTPAAVDPGGCDELALEQLFRDTVYATRGRCFPCHFENQRLANPDAPRWIAVGGNCDAASLTTMNNVVLLNLLNLEEPSQSLLLLKPLAESSGGVKHGGHDKFENSDDPGYLRLRYFIERYAACRHMPTQ